MPRKPLNLKAIYGSYDESNQYDYYIENDLEDEDCQSLGTTNIKRIFPSGTLYERALMRLRKAKTKNEVIQIAKIYHGIITDEEALEFWENYKKED